ncbi:hypothetical protein BKG93_06135 [Rodentibacter ratti]|uniref:Uncharacterized protein n=3 Tax=Rodentibacter TaxID=1960084 RepID=A0A1V3L5M7_9PAST|nr:MULTISPECIES: hypothetical protein [Rodentibacter]OOF53723.1 hypothetical protein BKK56_10880 [Rodentibacter genomosp. 2]OOF50762.1 hypothetical protein BKK52_01030 [Rodentibacter trehalosifermentans]OOF78813.1 hypothetical protein BKG96_04990 [Rodentibacter heylii]OOF84828.1 hypothetical protein BKG93_06135 [Rodentibacter ratti]QIA76812.1 hypothetical protein FEE42_05300 [Rodentibacter heylii]
MSEPDKMNLAFLIVFDLIGFAIIWGFYKYHQQARMTELKKIIRNALLRDFFNDDSLDIYIAKTKLKYDEVCTTLFGLLVELEDDSDFDDEAKLAYLRKISLRYQNMGFLSDLPVTLRNKMRALVKMNESSSELVFQIAQEIQTLNTKNQFKLCCTVVIGIITTSISIFQIIPEGLILINKIGNIF